MVRRNYTIGQEDAHLLGKVMDHMDDEALKALGFSGAERTRASWVYEDLDKFLNTQFGTNWDEQFAI